MSVKLRFLLFLLLSGLASFCFAGDGSPKDLATQSWGLFISGAVGAGLLALLTPCVFPIIPVTVSYFAKQAEKNPHQKLTGPIAYCLGIISTFTVVGVAVAVAVGAGNLNKFAQHPITNVVLGVLFVVLALSLFGVYEIQLPSWLVNKANKGRTLGGLVGPFMMGLTFAMTSFTCTVAFVGSVLALATDGVFRPIVGMVAFSSTFALPFFFLAIFPGAMSKLPKSGGWMQTVKGFMGFLELAAALKFFQNADIVAQTAILTYPVFLTIWFAIFIMGGLYLLGWIALPGHSEGKPGIFRWVFGTASIVFAVWLLGGLQGRNLGYIDAVLPPRVYPGQEAKPVAGQENAELVWIKDDFAKAATLAKKEGKNILIDFTGYS